MAQEKDDPDSAAAEEFVDRLEAGEFDGCLNEKLQQLPEPVLTEVARRLAAKRQRSASDTDESS